MVMHLLLHQLVLKVPFLSKLDKQKLARKNELKSKSTLLLAIPDEHLLKFHGIKDVKNLWEAIKTSNTNEAVNTAYEVSTANSQGQASSSSYANDVMFSFFVAMLTMRVKRFLKKTGRNLNFNGKETISFDKTKMGYGDMIRELSRLKKDPQYFALKAHLSSVPPPYNWELRCPSRPALPFAWIDDSCLTTIPTMNGAKPSSNVFHKSHSSVKRTIYQRTAPKNSDFKEKVNTAKDQGIFDSRCSRHMTGNKSYLTDYQDIDGGFVAFAGSPKG
ncbi:hypothetical protein Tco_0732551, partial [Tanacetum coccineum]